MISEVSAELIKYVPPIIKTVGVFVDEDLNVVKQHIIKYNLKAVQLHGKENVAYCAELNTMGIEIIKAFGVNNEFDFSILDEYLNVIDYFLFDTQTPEHGGSGKVFDWKLLSNYKLEKPYFFKWWNRFITR